MNFQYNKRELLKENEPRDLQEKDEKISQITWCQF
jgi:hypothetical protein